MNLKRMKMGIGILMALIVLCAGKIVAEDAMEARGLNGFPFFRGAASLAEQEVSDDSLKVKLSYSVMNQKATVKSAVTAKKGLKQLLYLSGKVSSATDERWENAKDITKDKKFSVKSKGNYSVLAVDEEGNGKAATVSVVMEMKAVWIYFSEINKMAKTYAKWKNFINTTFDTCKSNQMNTVILQVRPCADAMYPSKYYPWSQYATGKAGENPGFDPLEYAVEAAHDRGLSIQAWVNPYRITLNSTKISKLPANSIARKWANSKGSAKRNVLSVNGALYFNPASSQVRQLVTNGVKELVQNYDIDGVHMDDYFYPSLGVSNVKGFDYKEYTAYIKRCAKNKTSAMSLVNWRRENVNKMVRKAYKAVKSVDENCVFGISPAGNLENLYAKNAYFSDVKKWMKSSKYIDYICPQLYWSFTQKSAPYKTMVQKWEAIPRSNSVNLYIGLAGYRAGISEREARALTDIGWSKSNTILKRQVQYARNTGEVDGFMIFSYSTFTNSNAKKEVKNLQKVIGNR